MDSNPDVILSGAGWFGYSVSSAGDVNDDGYSDVMVGAETDNNYRGGVYVYYGGINYGCNCGCGYVWAVILE